MSDSVAVAASTPPDWFYVAQSISFAAAICTAAVGIVTLWYNARTRRQQNEHDRLTAAKERSLAACQSLIFADDKRFAWERISAATNGLTERGHFPPDVDTNTAWERLTSDADEGGSYNAARLLPRDTSLVINYLEVICLGIHLGFYEFKVVKSYAEEHVRALHRAFFALVPAVSSRWKAGDYAYLKWMARRTYPDLQWPDGWKNIADPEASRRGWRRAWRPGKAAAAAPEAGRTQ